jgi:hypothetical protein
MTLLPFDLVPTERVHGPGVTNWVQNYHAVPQWRPDEGMSQIVRDDTRAVVAGLGCLFVVPGPGETLQPVSSLVLLTIPLSPSLSIPYFN